MVKVVTGLFEHPTTTNKPNQTIMTISSAYPTDLWIHGVTRENGGWAEAFSRLGFFSSVDVGLVEAELIDWQITEGVAEEFEISEEEADVYITGYVRRFRLWTKEMIEAHWDQCIEWLVEDLFDDEEEAVEYLNLNIDALL